MESALKSFMKRLEASEWKKSENFFPHMGPFSILYHYSWITCTNTHTQNAHGGDTSRECMFRGFNSVTTLSSSQIDWLCKEQGIHYHLVSSYSGEDI